MEQKLLACAAEEIFTDMAFVDTDKIVFDPIFRPFCEENVCGKYGVNYTCPPDCGEPDEMKNRILPHARALVVQTRWAITDYTDTAAIKKAKMAHNKAMLSFIRKARAEGFTGVMCGASNCSLCDPCAKVNNGPCPHPDLRFSCMSAYCIHVKALADACGMDYSCDDGLLPFFGMFAFTPPEKA